MLRVLARQPDVAVRQKLQLQCCGTVRRHSAARVPPSSPTAREARPILPAAPKLPRSTSYSRSVTTTSLAARLIMLPSNERTHVGMQRP